ncbi:hypothetical protein [Halomonas binhaiensis]|uniref:DUF4124 domain-containing protein n=1 Tax=Halomonas binhaiensis TaxID=2562282 RepID=A0A5C1NHN1_9GAMM|nr:hypothetical protein [Halomonas binhaiensis]QEM81938.1 hypothetical protein E4T21_10510 [Halomonas binhaiensis]
MPMIQRALLATTMFSAMIVIAGLSGCTTYTWDDGHKETVWGQPTRDETMTKDEVESEAPTYRVPGETPE